MASRSVSSLALDALIVAEPATCLRAHGFKRSGRTFHRARDGWVDVVYVQASPWNTPTHATFYVNLQVTSPFFHEVWTGRPFPRNPFGAEWATFARLERERTATCPDRQQSWPVPLDASRVDTALELCRRLEVVAFPFFEREGTHEFLLAPRPTNCMGVVKHGGALQRAILLGSRGRFDEARIVIEEQFGEDRERWNAFVAGIVNRLEARRHRDPPS